MPTISPEFRTFIWIVAGIATVLVSYLSYILEKNLRYAIRRIITGFKGGRQPDQPTKRPWKVWLLYFLSTLTVIISTAVASSAPSSEPPAAETMHYFLIVDSSARMDKVFPGGDSKWDTINQAIHFRLLTGLPKRANYGLIVLGGNFPQSIHSCDQKESQVTVPMGLDNRDQVVNRIETLRTGGQAPLNDALVLAKDTLFSMPQNQHKSLLLFLGGGDDCTNDHWFFLKYFLVDTASLLSEARIDIVVFPGEFEIISAVNDIQETIDKNNLNARVTVYTPTNLTELNATIDVIQARELKYAQEFEPAAAAVAEATITAIAQLPTYTVQPTYTFQPTYSLPSPLPTYTPPPTNTQLPPLPTYTLLPTYTPQTPQPTYTLQPTYTPQTPQSTYTLQPTYTLPVPFNCNGWEFSIEGESNGWQIGQGITLDVRNGYMMGNISQLGSYWTGPESLSINASDYKTLILHYRIISSEISDVAYFNWITADDPEFENNKRIKFDKVQTNYSWQDMVFNLTSNIYWSGIITGMRLYPASLSGSSASVELDYIRLCE